MSNVHVDMEALVEHFRHEFKKSLVDALSRVSPGLEVDPNHLHREFVHAVRRSFRNSEELPSTVIK